jgi:hypothetical protein
MQQQPWTAGADSQWRDSSPRLHFLWVQYQQTATAVFLARADTGASKSGKKAWVARFVVNYKDKVLSCVACHKIRQSRSKSGLFSSFTGCAVVRWVLRPDGAKRWYDVLLSFLPYIPCQLFNSAN